MSMMMSPHRPSGEACKHLVICLSSEIGSRDRLPQAKHQRSDSSAVRFNERGLPGSRWHWYRWVRFDDIRDRVEGRPGVVSIKMIRGIIRNCHSRALVCPSAKVPALSSKPSISPFRHP